MSFFGMNWGRRKERGEFCRLMPNRNNDSKPVFINSFGCCLTSSVDSVVRFEYFMFFRARKCKKGAAHICKNRNKASLG